MKNDRQKALVMARWCRIRLASREEKTKETTESEPGSIMSIRNPIEQQFSLMLAKEAERVAAARAAGEEIGYKPHPEKMMLRRLYPNGLLQSMWMIREEEDDNTSKAGEQVLDEASTKMRDYLETIDTLQDPPVEYALMRRSSKRDGLYQESTVNDAFKKLATAFSITIVDCYRSNTSSSINEYRSVDYLRRTRSVWDVVYETRAEQKNSKTMWKDGKVAKKESKLDATDTLMNEEKIYGPIDIMKNARGKVRKAGTDPKIAKKEQYSEEDLQFRWLHLPANNVSA